MYISLLTDDYLKPSGKFIRIFVGLSREAPAVFKHDNKYYIITSGCTGWDPNEAGYAAADSIMGNWTIIGNPCDGPGSGTTFLSQSTYVLPVSGNKDGFIAMFDRWNKTNLIESRYVWLPVTFENGKLKISWTDRWDLNAFKNK